MKLHHCVAAALWHLYDTAGPEEAVDDVQMAFTGMFRVYSPTLQAVTEGLTIWNICDYLSRLEEYFPRSHALHARIDQALRENVSGSPGST